MTFNDLHVDAVARCRQSDVMLKQIFLNDRLEKEGLDDFKQDNFSDCRERAITIYMPYFDSRNETHRKFANLYALTIANHRSEIHVEDRNDEIAEYKQVVLSGFTDGEKRVEMASRRWWAG